jgi:site-specific DNA recombinase
VVLFAANEPITISGSRAQRILQRRINQAVAEYEVLQTLEPVLGGLYTHVRDGYNIGKPPMDTRPATIGTRTRPRPPAGRPRCAPTRPPHRGHGDRDRGLALLRRLGYDTIAERLNADPDRYPPPVPPGGAAHGRGAWGKTTVFEILRNPKYTGYQVFNRRASRSGQGKVNDPAKWVWSPEPTHEPLIAKWMYDELRARAHARRGSRDGAAPNTRPQTRRTYLLRGLTHCWCGRRMNDTQRRTRSHTDPRALTYYQSAGREP